MTTTQVKTKAKTKSTAPVKVRKTSKEFKSGDLVVYPAHGVGVVEAVEEQTIAELTIRLYNIMFEKDKLRLKIPTHKAVQSGLRGLVTKTRLQDAIKTMRGKPKVRRVMWSRRAQEYESKINSGDVVAVAEVLRDLRRNVANDEYSHSERTIFRNAMQRLASEVAAIEKIAESDAVKKIEDVLKDVA